MFSIRIFFRIDVVWLQTKKQLSNNAITQNFQAFSASENEDT